MSDGCVFLTQCIFVCGLIMKQYDVLVDISLRLNGLSNCAVKRGYLLNLLMESILRKYYRSNTFFCFKILLVKSHLSIVSLSGTALK